MTNEAAINKLIEMRLTTLADAYRTQLSDDSMQTVSFEDRFGLLIDLEYTTRKNNKRQRLIKKQLLISHRQMFMISITHQADGWTEPSLSGLPLVNTYRRSTISLLPEQPVLENPI